MLFSCYRRKDVKLFLSGWQNEEIMHTMHILLIYLQNSPPEQRPWVAVLLLHLDLLVCHLSRNRVIVGFLGGEEKQEYE